MLFIKSWRYMILESHLMKESLNKPANLGLLPTPLKNPPQISLCTLIPLYTPCSRIEDEKLCLVVVYKAA